MTRLTSVRTLVGAALAVLLSTFSLAPASAASAPVITWQGLIADGASFVYGQVPAAPSCTAVEDLSPVDCTVTGYDTSVGVHVLTATAVASDDVTETVETRTYTVTAWTLKGFLKPVRTGVVNTVKGGSTVPFKFKVFVDGAKAKSVDVVAAFTAQQYDCTTLAPIGTPVDVARDHKGFRLKFRDGAFHQNWKTPKLVKVKGVKGKKPVATGACYSVTLTAQDASVLTASFLLK